MASVELSEVGGRGAGARRPGRCRRRPRSPRPGAETPRQWSPRRADGLDAPLPRAEGRAGGRATRARPTPARARRGRRLAAFGEPGFRPVPARGAVPRRRRGSTGLPRCARARGGPPARGARTIVMLNAELSIGHVRVDRAPGRPGAGRQGLMLPPPTRGTATTGTLSQARCSPCCASCTAASRTAAGRGVACSAAAARLFLISPKWHANRRRQGQRVLAPRARPSSTGLTVGQAWLGRARWRCRRPAPSARPTVGRGRARSSRVAEHPRALWLDVQGRSRCAAFGERPSPPGPRR